MRTNYTRFVVVGISLILGTLSMQAARLNGIRIESARGAIVVYLNGEQICTASSSCFIANLSGGSYEIQVYDARFSGRETHDRREGLLFNERVYYSGRGIKDIYVREHASHRPSRPSGGSYGEEGMSRDAFEAFYRTLKGIPFDSDRTKLIETALLTSDFTSGQCRRLADTYTFDNEKIKAIRLMYPRIADKEAFFVVIEGLTFQSDKNNMNDFVKKYHSSRN